MNNQSSVNIVSRAAFIARFVLLSATSRRRLSPASDPLAQPSVQHHLGRAVLTPVDALYPATPLSLLGLPRVPQRFAGTRSRLLRD
jgi:hypothetical protein